MWTKQVTDMIIAGVGETLYMTLFSTFFGYVFGMPLGMTAIPGINYWHCGIHGGTKGSAQP